MSDALHETASAPEIQRADPWLRCCAVGAVLAGAIVGTLVIATVLPQLRSAIQDASRMVSFPIACWSFLVALVLIAGSVAAFGVYAVGIGRTVVRARRYPPPGMKVVRDTRVLTGRAAEIVGRVQTGLGAALIALALVLAALSVYAMARLAQ
jgi:hypothetical protein